MKCWRIFKHAWRLSVDNRSTALKIVAPFFAVTMLLQVVMTIYVEMEIANATILKVMLLATALFGFLASLWIAVAWHRFILIDEYPKTIPAFHGARIFSYFISGLLIGLMAFLVIIPLFVATGILQNANFFPWFSFPIWCAAVVGLTIITMRLMTLLPAAALGKPLTVRDTWQVTKGQNGTFFGLAVLLFLFALPFRIVSLLLNESPLLVGTIWETFSNIVLLIVTLSVLTTLYGHYVEKRPLVGEDQAVP